MTTDERRTTNPEHAPLWRENVEAEFADYLRDESRRVGRAGAIAFPRDEDEVIACLRETAADEGVTVQGGRTGITALTCAFYFFIALFFVPVLCESPASAPKSQRVTCAF